MSKTDEVRVVPQGNDDDLFAPLDLRNGPQPFVNSLVDIANEEEPEFAPEPEITPESVTPEAVTEPTPAAAAAPEPEVIEFGDGSTGVIEKTKKGWQITLDSGAGRPEVFKGVTKDEMWQRVAEGKLNATKKIRELNKQVKLAVQPTTQPAAPPQTPAIPTPQPRQLSADEVFEIKTQLESNPDLALEKWFQKKTGLSLEQLVSLAQRASTKADKGEQAKLELECEAVAKEFMSEHPDYFPTDENFKTVVSWLTKHKLGKPFNPKTSMDELMRSGHWTTENLNEAYEELTEDGLLEFAPASDEPEEEPAPVTPPAAPKPAAQPATDGRIVRQVRRPRAGLGIRPNETTPVTRSTETVKPPSAEELENLSDAEIETLMKGVRQERLRTASRR